MAVKAIGVLRTIEFDSGNITVYMDVHVQGAVHYNVSAGSFSAGGVSAVINAGIVAAIKDYAEESMSVTFGLLDVARVLTGLDLV